MAGDPDPVAGQQGAAADERGHRAALQQAFQPVPQLVHHLLLTGLADREVEVGGG